MFVAVNGVRGVYEVTGNGPPLVLLPSPLARARTYRVTADALGGAFRVYTVELPGSGRADSVGAGWPAAESAEWVRGVVARLGLGRPVVVAHSQAGPVGVALAARHPEAVGRLVLVEAMGTGPHPVLRVFAGGLVDLVREFGIVPGRWHHVAGNLFAHPRSFVRQVRDALAGDARAEAGRVTVPALVAWGGRSVAFPPRHAAEYARCLPDARVFLCPRGSHDWLIARPDEFAAAVAAFVRPGAADAYVPQNVR